VWTEYITTEDHVEYMVFPRALALSEMTWSQVDNRDFRDFARRLPWHLDRLDAAGIHYRIPDVIGLESDRLTLDKKVAVTLEAPVHGTIRYTVDGTEPTSQSPAYQGPMEADVEDGPVTVAARIFLPDGRTGTVRRATFTRTTLSPAALVDAPMESGVRVDLFEGSFRRVADLERRGQGTARTDPVEAVRLPTWADTETFGLRFRGYLDVPEDGVYTFRLTSDDGAVLRLAGATVLDHDGAHGTSEKQAQVALAKGLHPFEVLYFQAGGGKSLALEWAAPEGMFTEVGGTQVLRIR